jgi:hypothetical protein
MVADAGSIDAAAIASARAGEVFGLTPLTSSIQDFDDNITRFPRHRPAAAQERRRRQDDDRVHAAQRAGSLFKALSVFALRGVDLTKLESRPIPGRPWEVPFLRGPRGRAGRADLRARAQPSGRVRADAAHARVVRELEEPSRLVAGSI